MSTFGKIVGWIVGLAIICGVVTMVLPMLNQPSDLSVYGGTLIIAVVIAAVWLFLRWYFKNTKEGPPAGFTIVLVLLLASTTGCYKVVGPGYAGIKVSMSGDTRGVNEIPVSTGRVWYNTFTEAVYEYPTFIQSYVWTHSPHEGRAQNEEITFTTMDQMQVAVDISIGYHIPADKVPHFYVKFRNDDIEQFTHGFMRNLAREKFDGIAGKYKIEQIMGDNLPFLSEVRDSLQLALEPFGPIIDQFGLTAAPRPPQSVIDAINAKVEANQLAIKTENQVRQSKAQAEKDIAQAHGAAEANRILSQSINAQLLEWRRLTIQEQWIARWNGQRPNVEGSPGMGMLLQIPSK